MRLARWVDLRLRDAPAAAHARPQHKPSATQTIGHANCLDGKPFPTQTIVCWNDLANKPTQLNAKLQMNSSQQKVQHEFNFHVQKSGKTSQN